MLINVEPIIGFMSDVFSALAHPVRRQILNLLKQGPMTAGDLADAFPMSKPSMSRHFNTLKDANLIQAERDGTTIYYRLNISAADEALSLLMGLMGRNKPDEE